MPTILPYNIQNQRAARKRKLQYDPNERVYRDLDGYMILDEYG